MKSLFITLAATVACAAASITIVTPWANTTWVSGGEGRITWTSSVNDTGSCEIQLMNGNATNANMVAYVTSPGEPVNCSDNGYNISPLNDFAPGKYWIRIGERMSNAWVYSGVFTFQGQGTAEPLQSAPPFDNTVATVPSASSSLASSSTAVSTGGSMAVVTNPAAAAGAAGAVGAAAAASASHSGVAASASSQTNPSSGASFHRPATAVLSYTAIGVFVVRALAI